MSEAIAQQEPETINEADIADLVAPLPDVNPAAVEAERDQQADKQAQAAQADAPAPTAAPVEAPLPASAAVPPPAAAPKAQRSRRVVVDEKGRPFNPLLHECTDDGQPIMRSPPNDAYVRCRRQPLKEWKRASVVADEVQPEPAPAVEPAQHVDAQKQMIAAATIAGLQIMAMRMALGDKLAESDAERSELTSSWLAVFQHYGIGGSFHPLVALTLVSGSIVVGALRHEDTRSRLTKLWQWTQLKAVALWWRIRGRRPRTQADQRPDAATQQRDAA